MRTIIPIRGGLGDEGSYVFAGCFAAGISRHAPSFPPYWDDAHIPRTGTPVRFVRGRVEPFGVRWGLRNRYAFTPSRISR